MAVMVALSSRKDRHPAYRRVQVAGNRCGLAARRYVTRRRRPVRGGITAGTPIMQSPARGTRAAPSCSSARSRRSIWSASSCAIRSASSRRTSRARSALDAAEIGLLSSAFFFAFAAAQIPLGIAHRPLRAEALHAGLRRDRVSRHARCSPSRPRRQVSIDGRVLMGLGSSCYLMAPLALYAQPFPAGAVHAARRHPDRHRHRRHAIRHRAARLGERVDRLARDVPCRRGPCRGLRRPRRHRGARRCGRPDRGRGDGETLRESLRGVLEVTRMPSFVPVFLMQLRCRIRATCSSSACGAGRFSAHVYGYGLTARGDLLMLPAISHIVGVVRVGPCRTLCSAPTSRSCSPARWRRPQRSAGSRRSASRSRARWRSGSTVFGFLTAYTAGADRARALVPAAASPWTRHDAVQYRHDGRRRSWCSS